MNKIIEIKFGSHLYGTDTPNSDLDFKGIYLPTAIEVVLHKYRKTISTCRPKATCERNTKDDVDTEFFTLDRFLELLTDGQTVALDMLFAPPKSYSFGAHESGLIDPIMAEICYNKEKLLTRNVNAFVGYARQQAAKYGIKGSRMDALKRTKEFLDSLLSEKRLNDYYHTVVKFESQCSELVSLEKTPLVEIAMLKGPKGQMDAPHLKVNGRAIPFHATVKYAKEIVGKMLDEYGKRAHKAHLAGGVDWKALSHAVRVNGEAMELLYTGNITFPRPDALLLKDIKTGQIPYEQVAEMIEQGVADLHVAREKSILRDTPDQEWVDNFVYDVYSDIVRNS